MAKDTGLQDAIAKAEQELRQELSDKGEKVPKEASRTEVEVEVEDEETEEEGKETPPEESEDEKSDEEESDLNEDEAEEARKLYKALRDPNTSASVIAALAAQVGVKLPGADATKAETKEATRSISKIVEEALGPEYKFLSDKIGKAIEGALKVQSEQHEASLNEIRQSQIEREVTSAYKALARETKGESVKLEAKMAKLSAEIPIGEMSVDKYIKRLYNIVVAESQQTSAQKTADKINRNARNAPERLHGTPAGRETKIPDKKMNLNESVNFALSQLTKKG